MGRGARKGKTARAAKETQPLNERPPAAAAALFPANRNERSIRYIRRNAARNGTLGQIHRVRPFPPAIGGDDDLIVAARDCAFGSIRARRTNKTKQR